MPSLFSISLPSPPPPFHLPMFLGVFCAGNEVSFGGGLLFTAVFGQPEQHYSLAVCEGVRLFLPWSVRFTVSAEEPLNLMEKSHLARGESVNRFCCFGTYREHQPVLSENMAVRCYSSKGLRPVGGGKGLPGEGKVWFTLRLGRSDSH